MIEWLRDNRQWLFSGLGVSIIFVVGRLSLYLFRKGKSAVIGAENADHRIPIFDGADKSVAVQDGLKSADVIHQPVNRSPVLSLSAREILSQIRALPPLQQEDSFNSYKGMRIRHIGFVNFIRKGKGDTVNLELYQPNSSVKVVFSVSLADYPELKQIHENTPMVAEGTLQQLLSGNEFHLENVLLSHPPDTLVATPSVMMDRTEAYMVLQKMWWDRKIGHDIRDAIKFATWYLFPECHFWDFKEPITPEQKRGLIETLAVFKSERIDSAEQRAIDRALKSLGGNFDMATDTPPDTPYDKGE